MRTVEEQRLFALFAREALKNGPTKINYVEMADAWNRQIIDKLKESDSPRSVLSKYRFKTPAFLREFQQNLSKWASAKTKLDAVKNAYRAAGHVSLPAAHFHPIVSNSISDNQTISNAVTPLTSVPSVPSDSNEVENQLSVVNEVENQSSAANEMQGIEQETPQTVAPAVLTEETVVEKRLRELKGEYTPETIVALVNGDEICGKCVGPRKSKSTGEFLNGHTDKTCPIAPKKTKESVKRSDTVRKALKRLRDTYPDEFID